MLRKVSHRSRSVVEIRDAVLESLRVVAVGVGLVLAIDLLVEELVHEVELRGLGADVVLGTGHADQVDLERDKAYIRIPERGFSIGLYRLSQMTMLYQFSYFFHFLIQK